MMTDDNTLSPPLQELPSWKKLTHHYASLKKIKMRDLFESDPQRFQRYSIIFDDMIFDYSKNIITDETLSLLISLAKESKVEEWRDKMFAGEPINTTENRQVLHVALRTPPSQLLTEKNSSIAHKVQSCLLKMKKFVHDIRSGQWLGAHGDRITDIVNIGIGGSDLGPMMVTEALKPYHSHIKAHFVSNVDPTHLTNTIASLNPATTLFIISSKTFTTQETLMNAQSARAWLIESLGPEAISHHCVAVSTNIKAVTAFGINPDAIFEFWDWVGGRYSLWSAIGLPIALTIGMENFEALLLGAHESDQHFKTAPLDHNIPVLMALLGLWYRNFFKASAIAILPYDQNLYRFPAYLQQADMESNGKSIRRGGDSVSWQTGPILFGEPGTNGQHAFYQLLHQGTDLVPADFIGAAQSHNPMGQHHSHLLANLLAQSRALMFGRQRDEVILSLKESELLQPEQEILSHHREFIGNRPSNSLLYQKLTPKTLGRLIALYEHKIFVQGIIWDINSFDQWGVELGKQIAQDIFPILLDDKPVDKFDSSTNGLIEWLREHG